MIGLSYLSLTTINYDLLIRFAVMQPNNSNHTKVFIVTFGKEMLCSTIILVLDNDPITTNVILMISIFP